MKKLSQEGEETRKKEERVERELIACNKYLDRVLTMQHQSFQGNKSETKNV